MSFNFPFLRRYFCCSVSFFLSFLSFSCCSLIFFLRVLWRMCWILLLLMMIFFFFSSFFCHKLRPQQRLVSSHLTRTLLVPSQSQDKLQHTITCPLTPVSVPFLLPPPPPPPPPFARHWCPDKHVIQSKGWKMRPVMPIRASPRDHS